MVVATLRSGPGMINVPCSARSMDDMVGPCQILVAEMAAAGCSTVNHASCCSVKGMAVLRLKFSRCLVLAVLHPALIARCDRVLAHDSAI